MFLKLKFENILKVNSLFPCLFYFDKIIYLLLFFDNKSNVFKYRVPVPIKLNKRKSNWKTYNFMISLDVRSKSPSASTSKPLVKKIFTTFDKSLHFHTPRFLAFICGFDTGAAYRYQTGYIQSSGCVLVSNYSLLCSDQLFFSCGFPV